MKLPEPMKQLSDDYIRGWNECLQAVRDLNNTEEKDDGWIPWGGGECPVKDTMSIRVRFRNGCESGAGAAGCCAWNHVQDGSDIVAYKVVGQ